MEGGAHARSAFGYRLFVVFLLFSLNASATNSEHISAQIIHEDSKFGIELKLDDGWHTYYKEPGDAGVPTTFKFDGSTDFTLKNVEYPPSKPITEYGLKTNAYEGTVFFPVEAVFGPKPHLQIEITGAVCKDVCIPYDLKLSEDVALQKSHDSYFVILLTAFFAGLILNIMPCVLPVLSLKVLGVIKQAGVDRRRARFNFMATAAGIIVSFWLVAIFVMMLKSAGMEIGWGMQFQSPVFVGILILVTLAFALSLFGVFHLRPPSWISGRGEHNSLIGNFISGALATLLGTSCTAPVLATAVGFALGGNYFDIVLVFTVMGVGMALPFVLLALMPQLIGFLPKPGKWMLWVKYLMGVLLLATALWLGSILMHQLNFEPEKGAVVDSRWVAFDEKAIDDHVAKGQVVFVDITADWCINCKVNESRVLNTYKMGMFFDGQSVVMMRGDMTRPNKVLLHYIRGFGRYGIPFNIVYGPGARDGILLSPLLTEQAVEQAILKAEGK